MQLNNSIKNRLIIVSINEGSIKGFLKKEDFEF